MGQGCSVCFCPSSEIYPRIYGKYDEFTLSFFDGEYKKELGICGAKSGRDIDKAAETGLVPEYIDNAVTFKQAKKVLVCKKVAFKDMTPDGFLDSSIEKWYTNKDYHRIYVGTIEKTLISE